MKYFFVHCTKKPLTLFSTILYNVHIVAVQQNSLRDVNLKG